MKVHSASQWQMAMGIFREEQQPVAHVAVTHLRLAEEFGSVLQGHWNFWHERYMIEEVLESCCMVSESR